MRFYSNKFASELAVGTRHLNSGLKVMLLNGRRAGNSMTSGGVVTMADTTGLKVGMNVEERDSNENVITTHVPSGRTIGSVDSSTQITLSSGGGYSTASGMTLYFHPNRDFDTVDQVAGLELGISPNPSFVGYTGAFGGAGRKTLAGVSSSEDDTNDWALVIATDLTWSATFGPGWITGYAFVYETGGADSASRFAGYSSDGGFPSFANGNAFPLSGFNANGIAKITT